MRSTPCEAAPDDWFIESNGRQYPDDELVADWEVDAATFPPFSHDSVKRRLVRDAQRAALIRRRQARDACRSECPVRTECLGIAIQERRSHGTWGGYYPEELNTIYYGIDRRREGRR